MQRGEAVNSNVDKSKIALKGFPERNQIKFRREKHEKKSAF